MSLWARCFSFSYTGLCLEAGLPDGEIVVGGFIDNLPSMRAFYKCNSRASPWISKNIEAFLYLCGINVAGCNLNYRRGNKGTEVIKDLLESRQCIRDKICPRAFWLLLVSYSSNFIFSSIWELLLSQYLTDSFYFLMTFFFFPFHFQLLMKHILNFLWRLWWWLWSILWSIAAFS